MWNLWEKGVFIMDDLLIAKIKKVLTDNNTKDFIFECLDCNTKFDGKNLEEFIRHQIKMLHFNYEEYKK